MQCSGGPLSINWREYHGRRTTNQVTRATKKEHDTGDYDDHDDYTPGNKYKVVYGTKDDDKLEGTYKDEIFFAGKGNDTVYGNGGDDIIFGQKGND